MAGSRFKNYKHSDKVHQLVSIYYNIIMYSDQEVTFDMITNLTFTDYKKKRSGKCLGRFNLD
jgi:hypothetical protein